MMPNITRGDDARGLMRYLVGAGKANEHELPHVVGGHIALTAGFEDQVLTENMAMAMAGDLEAPMAMWQTPVAEGHIWHCSLSLGAGEGALTDQQWGRISREFLDGMRITNGPAPVRWVAVRHGLSQEGNDHVHLAVNLVREDGSVVNVRNAWPRSQAMATQLEQKHGLKVLQSRLVGVGAPAYTQAEHQVAKSTGRVEPERVELARTVRACSAASVDEAEFVRRLRAEGVAVKPRWDADGRRAVGYSVALPPVGDRKQIWFSGGKLAADLTLPRLRTAWPDGRVAAGPEWAGTARTVEGRETALVADPDAAWDQIVADLKAQTASLVADPVTPQDLAYAAHDLAGALAAASTRLEPVPGELAALSRDIGRIPQTRFYDSRTRPHRAGVRGTRGAALLLMQACDPTSPMGQAVMVKQLLATARAVMDVHRAHAQASRRERQGPPMTEREDGIDEALEGVVTQAVTAGAFVVQQWADIRSKRYDPTLRADMERLLPPPAPGQPLAPMTEGQKEAAAKAAAASVERTRWAEATANLSPADQQFFAANQVLTDPAVLDDPAALESAEAALARMKAASLGDLPGGQVLLEKVEANLAEGYGRHAAMPSPAEPVDGVEVTRRHSVDGPILAPVVAAAVSPTVEPSAVEPVVSRPPNVGEQAEEFLARVAAGQEPETVRQGKYIADLQALGADPRPKPAMTKVEASAYISAQLEKLGMKPGGAKRAASQAAADAVKLSPADQQAADLKARQAGHRSGPTRNFGDGPELPPPGMSQGRGLGPRR